MLQLPAVRPRLGKLQATPLFLVLWQPPAQGVLGEGEGFINIDMLQLPVGGRGESSPLKLPGLQSR
jgi:hypothetical protein